MNSWFEPDLILLVRFCITCRAHVLRRHRSYFTDASILICTLCTLCVLRRACSVWTAWYAVATTLWTATSSLVLLLRLRPALPTLPILNSKSFAWHSPYLHLVYLQVQSCSSIFLLQFCNFNVQTFNQLITAAFESADCFVVRTTRPCFNVSKPSWIDLLFWVLLSVRHMYWRPERFVFPTCSFLIPEEFVHKFWWWHTALFWFWLTTELYVEQNATLLSPLIKRRSWCPDHHW